MSTKGYGADVNIVDNILMHTDIGNKLCRDIQPSSAVSAGDFDSGDRLTSSSSALSFGNEDVTFVVWCFMENNVANTSNGMLIGRWSVSGDKQMRLIASNNLERFQLQVWNGATVTTVSSSNNSWAADQWAQVVGVHDSVNDELRLYVNGVLETTLGSYTAGISGLTGVDFSIGGTADTGSNTFTSTVLTHDSFIDECGVYGSAWVLSDVVANYNGGGGVVYSTADKTNLISYWSLVEGTGATRVDSHSTNDLTDASGVLPSGGGISGGGSKLVDLVDRSVEGVFLNGLDFVSDTLPFDGVDDYVDADLFIPKVSGQTTGTIEIVAEVSQLFFEFDTIFSFSKDTVSPDEFMYVQVVEQGKIRFICGTPAGNDRVILTTNSNLAVEDVPFHVVVTQDGVSAKIYFNSVLVGQTHTGANQTYWFNRITAPLNCRLGALKHNGDTESLFLSGKIHVNKVYSDVADQTAVNQLYRAIKHRFN